MKIFNIVNDETCKLCAKVNEDQTITITEINSYTNAEDYEYKNIQIDIIKQINYTNETILNYKRHTLLFTILTVISLVATLIYAIATSINGTPNLIITIILMMISAFFVLLIFIPFPYKTNTTCFSIDTEQNINLFSSYDKDFNLEEIINFTEYINSLK